MTQRPIQPPSEDWTALRVARGVSLRQIAESTKICVRYLEAIERGAFQELPGGAYTEGFIRQYARAVGDTRDILLNSYRWSLGPVETDPLPDTPEPATATWRLGEILRSWLRLAT